MAVSVQVLAAAALTRERAVSTSIHVSVVLNIVAA